MNTLKSKYFLDWNDLNVFSEVVKTGSFSAAGKRLNLSHMTVSRRIARLEEQFGSALLEKVQGKLRVTEFGKKIIPFADQMQQAMDDILGQKVVGELSGVIKISSLYFFSKFLLIPRLVDLRRQHPNLEIRLDINEYNVNLRKGEADIALRFARSKDSTLRAQKLADVGYGIYICKSKITEKNHSLITYDSTKSNLPEALWLRSLFPSSKIAAQANSLPGQIDLIAAGLGIGALPHILACQNPDLVRIPRTPEITRELWLLIHPRSVDIPRFRPLLRRLKLITPIERDYMRYGYPFGS